MLDLAAVRTDAVPLAVESNTSLGFALDVNASQSGWVFIDRAWWSAWEVTVDGARTSVSEAHGGQVFEVAAGHHRVVGTLTMEDARLGGFAGLLTLMGVGIWLAWPRLRDRMRRHH